MDQEPRNLVDKKTSIEISDDFQANTHSLNRRIQSFKVPKGTPAKVKSIQMNV